MRTELTSALVQGFMTTRRDFLLRTTAAGIATAASRRFVHAAKPNGTTGSGVARAGEAETVLGPIDASRLGFTLPHEHVADAPDDLTKWPKAWGGRAEFVATAVKTLKEVRADGVSTIVDLTTYDVGRNIRFLEEVSRKSGLNIIACTGQRFFPPITHVSMAARTIEGLAEFFRMEIEQGIDGTTIKAGVIKIGIVSKELTSLEETGLRAAARASKATGFPIRTHTDAAHRAAENHAAILEDEGINPARVSFDHSDDSWDMDYFLGLVRRGYSLSMDHLHRGLIPKYSPSFARRAECIKLLVDAGFADKIFLSQDAELGGSLIPENSREWRETIDPPEGLFFTARKAIPYLKQLGVSQQAIHTMTVENPKRFFGRS